MQKRFNRFFESNTVDQVYLAAAKVGGIHANNTYPAEFIYENLMIEANVIHAAHLFDVQKLLFLGSSCIYPKHAEQPMRENALLTGVLEATNEPYAIAKIAGIKLCESYNRQYGRDYRSVMPTNLYGPNDNFHPENSHVIPALIRRFHEAIEREEKEVVIWGSGMAKREFLHVDDMAAASTFVMELPQKCTRLILKKCSAISMWAPALTIQFVQLAESIAKVCRFNGELVFDTKKPDGTPRKLMDVRRMKALGWESQIGLERGLRDAYSWYLNNVTCARGQCLERKKNSVCKSLFLS